MQRNTENNNHDAYPGGYAPIDVQTDQTSMADGCAQWSGRYPPLQPGDSGYDPNQTGQYPPFAATQGTQGYPFSSNDFLDDDAPYAQPPCENPRNVQQNQNDGGNQGDSHVRSRKSGLLSILLTFAILCIAVLILNAKVLRLSTITVNGLVTLDATTVAEAAGLSQGMSYLGIDADKVRDLTNENRYLQFISLEKHFPNAVTLNVKERVPKVNLMVMGVMYVLDEDGMVLERSNNVMLDNGLPTVTGMQTREARVGHVIVAQKANQTETMRTILDELDAQGYASEISELNLSNLESLYLITIDGYTVNIGGVSEIRAKIGTMRAVVTSLREMGKTGGVIDATVPGEATYSPDNL